MKRGEVVQVNFPFADGPESKVRPGLVVQSDLLKIKDTIIAGISSTPSDTSVLLVPDEKTGIKKPCYIRCEKLHSLSQSRIYGSVGRLPQTTMREVEDRLRFVLGLQRS